MYQIIKRDGRTVDFDSSKISNAIKKAFNACNTQYNDNIIDFLTLKVTAEISSKVQNNSVSIEDIQDCVENVLIKADYTTVAKAYILYRKQHENLRVLNYKKLMEDYLEESDWRVKENSTVTHTLGGLILSNSGAVTANYWLSEVYDKEIADAHRNCDIHIHDLSILGGYCSGWSLKQLIEEGLGGVEGRISSKPASHLSTLCNQIVNFLGCLQNEFAGAQAFSSFDTYLAPFVKADNLTYDEVKQCIQSLVFGLNTPSRWGCVPITTQILTPTGFKKYGELKKGDMICTWVDGQLKQAPLNEIIIKQNDFKVLHRYRGEHYKQIVSPEHRCIVKTENDTKYRIRKSNEIIKEKALIMPTHISEISLPYEIQKNDDIKFAVAYYASEKMGINGKISKKFLRLNKEQSLLFLKTWALKNGYISEHKIECKCDRELIREQLCVIMLRAGYLPYLKEKEGQIYVCALKRFSANIDFQDEIPYDGLVWCPNTEDGTAIFKDENENVFISGNCQAPFTNITIDWTVPDDLKDLPAIVGGKEMNFTYGDCKKEMDMINRAFIEVMLEGDANGRGFQYPIPTYSITKDFNWSETRNNKLLFEMTAKYGTPYFSNYVNSDMNPSDVRSMCCRLRLDLRELFSRNGGYFGSGENTGSIGVVTINMPRIAYLSKDKEYFFNRLSQLMDVSARSLKLKRTVVEKLFEENFYPYAKRYLKSGFHNHFSTIGIIGMNEVGLNANWLRKDLSHKETQDFAVEVLNFMRNKLSDYQEQYGDLYNLEATPAESTTYRFAKYDKKKYPDIITATKNGDTPFYTNSSHLPVDFSDDIFSALDIQDKFQPLYTSGTVFHGFLGEKLPDWHSTASLVHKIATNYKLPYFTLSPTYSICKNHGYITGEVYECPECKEKTEVYSRITGYYRPVQNFNDGKAQEFKQRKEYRIMKEDNKIYQENCRKKYVLFTTRTCPKCKIVKKKLNDEGILYEEKFVEDHIKEAKELGLKQAPSLLIKKVHTQELLSGFESIVNRLEESKL